MRTWARRSVSLWALVNLPGFVAFVMAQTVGVPGAWLYLWAAALHVVLMPGLQLCDLAARALGARAMPGWYYSAAFPFAVALVNLGAYLCGGAAISVVNGILWWRHDRQPTRPATGLDLKQPNGRRQEVRQAEGGPHA